MIKRIVKLTFRAETAAEFPDIFHNSKPHILEHQGCSHVEMWQDTKDSNTYFTYSFWNSEADLNAYRKGNFFGGVWPRTKSMLAQKPEAWSVTVIES